MICSSCGTDNPPGQKFCGECGGKLAAGCPACGATNPPGQKFCGECGSALGGTAAATPSGATSATGGPDQRGASSATAALPDATAVAERRLVSVLFADLVGFTPFAEERDSEEVRETLTRYFDMAREVIEQYGGTVEKFIGDAVMAVWGTPTAREDDAERAVRAGLELVTAIRGLGPTIQVRAGVFTGEAAVTLGATNQGMVAGDVVNTAARIQSVAPPGACLVGESTFRAASAAIAFEEAGEPTLKGKSAPVPVWRAMRVVAERGGRGRSDTLEAPFVGRDDQLRLLKELYHTTIRERRTRLISVTGIGGVGKSRLAWEFEKYLDGLVERVLWHHGRSPAYGQGVTFWALGEMVRYRCGLVETDGEQETRSKVAETIAEFIQDPAERRWVESSLLALLGVEGPGDSSEELFAGWRTFFERLAATAPIVMVFEDLHWADPGTLDFIDHLLDWAKNIPLAIITLARPELLERRPDWGAGRRNFVGLALEPLPEPAMRELLAGLVPGLPEPTVRAIVERAGGIPLYAVETVRTLVADHRLELRDGVYEPVGDLTSLAIPDTLTALIAARLDALDPADRALLLDAAVLGQSFSMAGLAAVSGQSVEELEPRLRALVRREILSGTGDLRSPERGQFIFVQALIREVAYNTLARRDRKERHLAAARFFESLESGEIAGALAGQYLAAHQNAAEGPEADALAAQARIALSAAAERAASLGAHSQAVTFLEQAMSVTADPGERADLLERAGTAAGVTGDHDGAIRLLEDARDLRAQAGDRRLLARVTAALGRTLLDAKHRNQAQTMLETAAATFADLEGSPELATIHSQLARAYYFAEENRRAVEVADRVLETAEHQNLIPLLADTLVTKGSALGGLGRVREASAVIDAGGRLAEAAGLTFTALRALNNRLIWEGEVTPREALAACWDGLALARRVGQRGWAMSFAGNGAFQAFRIGEWDAARRELEAALEDASDPSDESLLLNNLANLLAARGEPYEETFARLQASVTGLDPDHAAGLVEETRAWIALAQGDLAEAQRAWERDAASNASVATPALCMSAHTAMWAGGLEHVRADLAAIDASGIHGAAIDAQRIAIRAGIAGLEGRRGDALAGYREAAAAWQTLDLPWDAALMAFDMAAVLGPTEPEVKAALDTAETTLRALGAKPFLERLEMVRAGTSGPTSAARSAPAPKAAEVETPT
jgi:class 3 adenylate cyclase/tetratricopeptide (TPR) repeat protein